MNEKRVRRISSEINKVVSELLYKDLKNPNIDPLYTGITGVKVTNDLSFAYIYISVIGDEIKKEETLKGFEESKGFIRKEISRQVDLRHTPTLIFKLDESYERGMHIESILNELKSDGEKNV
ncbi:30S ribosome-binding factor RbfA [Lagierella sp.]|uniref:30S ribosome-binding factor RbfA n=1 Tax=Lagierella sp. TaxID=2849657 RepID=UPI00260E1385|nr:30S ribosome-binding factor RbfA [Lagierella sp.]